MRFLQLLSLYMISITHVNASVAEVEQFLRTDYEQTMTRTCNKVVESRYRFHTDIANDAKVKNYINDLTDISKIEDKFGRKLSEISMPFIIDDKYLERELKHALMGFSFTTAETLRENAETAVALDKGFNTAKVCPYHNQNCNLKTEGLHLTDIEDVMADSLDYDELLYFWTAWRKATAGLKKKFKIYHRIENRIAIANNFSHLSEYQKSFYDSQDDVGYTKDLWNDVEPLYLELHKYVTRKLEEHYGDKLNASDGLLPAHVLGNMWAESWYNIETLVRPFPNVSDGNLELNMRQSFRVEDIFRAADEFFQSLGLAPMGPAYEGPDQVHTKPTDGREVACHPISSDFCNGTYRVTICGKVNLENFIDIHHELGHIQYFIQYKDLPYLLRDSASTALHETIGETIALSATSPSHLNKLELLTNYRDTYESSINFLMKMALIKIAFLPFGMLVDMWKWDVVSMKVPESQWNSHWWEYRMSYQGVKPPVPRSDATDFDPIAMYHVAVNGEYITYFHAHFMEFQIYKALCLTAREYDPAMYKICPLHNCDFYNSKEVGKKLADAMKLGYMKPWEEVLEMLTGSKKIESGPLLEYFQPLYEFLKVENEKADEKPEPHILKKISSHEWPWIIVIFVIVAIVFLVAYLKFLRHMEFRRSFPFFFVPDANN